MKKLFYSVEIRDNKNKLYKTDSGSKVHNFKFESSHFDEYIIKAVCKETFEEYQAICKVGSIIEISVRYLDSISGAYPLLYSFCACALQGENQTFVKH